MNKRIPTLALRSRQRGIGFLVVVLIIGVATITAGTGVTVYKISQGQQPSLEIELAIKEGKAKLKVDPELGASLESHPLGAGGASIGLFSGGMTFNRFLVRSAGEPAPAGYEAVVDDPDAGIRLVSDPGLGSTAHIDVSQTLAFTAHITDASLPFSTSGGLGFVTTVTGPEGTATHATSAVWSGDGGGLAFGGHDAIFVYDENGLHLEGSGTAVLASSMLAPGDSLEWTIAGDPAALAASLIVSSVPEPGVAMLMGVALVLVTLQVGQRCRNVR